MHFALRRFRSERIVVTLRLLLAAATACAWTIAVALKPMFTQAVHTGLPGQQRAYTLGRIAAESRSVQLGFGLRSYEALEEWSKQRSGYAACGHATGPMNFPDRHRASVRLVTRDCLGALAAPLIAGRLFDGTEHATGTSSHVCIVSQRTAERLAGQVEVGKTLHGLDRDCTIVGIMSASVSGFSPEGSDDDLWMPLESSPGVAFSQLADLESMPMIHLAIVAARDDMAAPNRDELEALLHRTSDFANQQRLVVEPGVSTDIGHRRDVANLQATALLVAVALFIATLGNSALLTESVLMARRHTLAIRTAVGASPARLLRELIAESAVFALLGSALGVLAAYGLLQLAIDVDGNFDGTPVTAAMLAAPVTFALAATLVQLVAATLISAARHVRMTGSALAEGLARNRSSAFLRSMLRIQLFAAALVLMVTVASIGRFYRLLPSDAGMDMSDMTIVRIRDSQFRYMSDDPRIQPIVTESVGRLRSVPGIESASVASLAPVGIDDEFRKLEFPGSVRPITVRVVRVLDRYAGAVGLQILRGTAKDFDEMAPATAFIDDALLARYQGMPPDTIRFVHEIGASGTREFKVRGVVRRMIHGTTRGPAASPIWQPNPDDPYSNGEFPTLYLPYDGFADPVFIVRSRLAPGDIARRVGEIWAQASPTGRVTSFVTATETLQALVAKEKLLGIVFAIGSITLLLIVAAAMFGSIAVTMATRQRNSAIALALGAPPTRLLRRELGWSATTSLLSTCAALPLAYFAVALIGDAIPMDLAETVRSFGISAGIMVVVAVVAMLPLTVRIANTNPNVLLRV